MRSLLVSAGCLLVLTGACFGQSTVTAPLTFKGFTLGMPLAEFKTKAAGDNIWIESRVPNDKGKLKMVKIQVSTPLCTDTMDGFPGSDAPDRQPGEVICNPAPPHTNLEQLVVAEFPVTKITYRFFSGRLYRIEMSFAPIRYRVIKGAFTEKYGQPASTSREPFTNAYGAAWTGEDAGWRFGKQSIVIVEGSGNGPGQDQFDPFGSGASFEDASLAPKIEGRSHVDF